MPVRRADRWLTPPELARRIGQPPAEPPPVGDVIGKLISRRKEFGISRIGSVTGLDVIGIPVIQTVRPLSLSVAVNQGKGLTVEQAIISALMESLEGWASEYVPVERLCAASLEDFDQPENWRHLLESLPDEERQRPLAWIEGWDLLGNRVSRVPAGLVDTAYVVPSAYPPWMERVSTGLAAGTTLHRALIHACLEVLERHVRALAMQTPHFFDRNQVQASSITHGKSATLISFLNKAGFVVGIWTIPFAEGVAAFWCQVMEGENIHPLAPLPASGFGCDLTQDEALTKALLEACQSRLGFISSAREDVTMKFYDPEDHRMLSDWRSHLQTGGAPLANKAAPPVDDATRLQAALCALEDCGASAAVAIPLYADDDIPLYVLRVVAPPLHSNPEASDED